MKNRVIRLKIRKKRTPTPGIGGKILLGVLVVFFSTLGIDAADHYGDFSQSIVGRLLPGRAERCQSDMVFVSSSDGGFCIDKYEVSAGKKCEFSSPSNINESQANVDNAGCQAVSTAGEKPWVNITQSQAVSLCAKAGKRLPSNEEWSMAALGTRDSEKTWGADDCQVAKNWNSQPGLTGSGKDCYSYAGAFDMVGNVWEWVNGAVENGTYNGRKLPSAGYVQEINPNDSLPSMTGDAGETTLNNDFFWLKDTGTRGILRGGYWENKSDAGQYSAYAVEYPRSYGPTIGFRCVK